MLCFQNNDADCSLIITQCRRVLQFPSIIEIAFFIIQLLIVFSQNFSQNFILLLQYTTYLFAKNGHHKLSCKMSAKKLDSSCIFCTIMV